MHSEVSLASASVESTDCVECSFFSIFFGPEVVVSDLDCENPSLPPGGVAGSEKKPP